MGSCISKQPRSTEPICNFESEREEKEVESATTDVVINTPAGFRMFSFEELVPAIKEENFLGSGDFGKVYKGYLSTTDDEEIVVAIKKLDPDRQQGHKDLLSECTEVLPDLDHPNIVQLFGICEEQGEMLLVYEFMPSGRSVADHLFGPFGGNIQPLDWNTRIKIATGAAKGLEYLHSKKILHGDFKASNILLGEGYHPKVTDFGSARRGVKHGLDDITIIGGIVDDNCAPEYAMTGRFVTESDVYSFGIVLLELITGRRAYDWKSTTQPSFFPTIKPILNEPKKFRRLIDPVLGSSYSWRGLHLAVHIAKVCMERDKRKWVDIGSVVVALTYLTEHCEFVTIEGLNCAPKGIYIIREEEENEEEKS